VILNLHINIEIGVSTVSGLSRKMFDTFYRALLNGQNTDYPKPKVFKLARNQLFPERDLVFEWFYDKKNNGTWVPWTDIVDKTEIQLAPTAKVSQICMVGNPFRIVTCTNILFIHLLFTIFQFQIRYICVVQ
jgi:hypothetical protein